MLKFVSLASSSKGNSYFIGNEKTKLIIDCGLSGKKLKERLETIEESADNIDGVIVTHEHSDHVLGVGVIARRHNIPIYLRPDTYLKIKDKLKNTIINKVKYEFIIKDFEIKLFSLPHDCADPVGVLVKYKDKKIGIMTDCGFVTELSKNTLKYVDLLVLESNYDEKLIFQSDRPLSSVQRTRSRLGHLSNDSAIEFLESMDFKNLKHLFIGHISEDHNDYNIINEIFKNSIKKNKFNFDLEICYSNKVSKTVIL